MLTIYTDLKTIDKPLIRANDLFFNSETELEDTELVRKILKTIDQADYNSELTFLGRTKTLGALNKNMLSTGSKTLLNIIAHPDICFDVCECGNNALCLLPLIKNGNIYWKCPVAAYDGNETCDIYCKGRKFTDFYEFLESMGD